MIAPETSFDELTAAHVSHLVAGSIREDRTLEFKRDLPAETPEARREFLADATSFANAGGGDILFGIREEHGVAVAIVGCIGDADSAISRIESMIRDPVEPRVPGVRYRAIDLSTGWVLLLRIPASWTGPHAVRSSSGGADTASTRAIRMGSIP